MADGPSAGRRTMLVGALRGSGLVLNVAVAVVLGRMLGVRGYGAYAAAIGLATILTAPAALGGRPLLIRGTATYLAAREWGLLRGLIRRSLGVVALTSCVLGAGTCAVILAIGGHSTVKSAMLASAVLLPLMTIGLLTQGLLQGLRRVTAAFAPPTLLRPLVMLAALGLLAALGTDPSPQGAVLLQGIALGLPLVVTALLVRRALPGAVRTASAAYASREWLRRALPMGLSSALFGITGSVGVTLAAAIAGPDEAGLLAGAMRVATAVMLLTWAANEAFQPDVARAWVMGEAESLQRAVTSLTRSVAATTTVAAATVAVLAGPVLRVFGTGFGDGATALRLLCIAVVVNAAGAVNVTLLNMTEHQRGAAQSSAAGLVTTVSLSALMIPAFGAAGGAGAFLGGTLARNLLASHLTRTKLGLESTVLGARTDRG
jgi:O-antigen/teichoic acid export membrane protein